MRNWPPNSGRSSSRGNTLLVKLRIGQKNLIRALLLVYFFAYLSLNLFEMTILENKYVRTDFEAEHFLAHSTWTKETGSMSKAEYFEIFDELAALLAQYQVKLWLGDTIDFLVPVTPDMQNWIATAFTPKVVASGLLKMALVMPTDIIPSLSVEQTVEEMQEQNVQVFLVNYFDQVDQARAWLLAG
jgi:hypothetical protein